MVWRRYSARAEQILIAIRGDRAQAEHLIDGVDFLRAETEYTAEHEMVTKRDDLLRRRTRLSQIVKHQELVD